MYAANHHLTLDGKRFVPGEVLPDDLPEDKKAWWLSVDAIREIEGAAAFAPPPAESPKSDGGDDADAPEDTEDDADGPDDPEDEIDDADEPEEIDVMAGVVSEPAPDSPTAGVRNAPAADLAADARPKRAARRNGGKKS